MHTRQFLRDLLDPKTTPRVPREIRMQAARCLRHYPSEFDLLNAEQRGFDAVFASESGWEKSPKKVSP